MPTFAQVPPGGPVPNETPVPEVVRPRAGSPTLPPSVDGREMPRPRSDNPQVEGSGRPMPDRGMIAPPAATQDAPVIRPPVSGTMPVIPPPGSPGGDGGVVPK